MELTLDTWIISDTHFNHDNIVKYCGRPENHTEIIFDNWLAHIHTDDDVLHLGDVFMGKKQKSLALLGNLPGNKYFIRGNHDKSSIKLFRDVGFTHVGEVIHNGTKILNAASFITDEKKRVLFTHYPDIQFLDKWDINIHGHIHNNGYSPSTPKERDYRNVSIDVMDYKPVRLREILYNNAYVSRADAPEWEGQTQREGEHKVILPSENEVGYYGASF